MKDLDGYTETLYEIRFKKQKNTKQLALTFLPPLALAVLAGVYGVISWGNVLALCLLVFSVFLFFQWITVSTETGSVTVWESYPQYWSHLEFDQEKTGDGWVYRGFSISQTGLPAGLLEKAKECPVFTFEQKDGRVFFTRTTPLTLAHPMRENLDTPGFRVIKVTVDGQERTLLDTIALPGALSSMNGYEWRRLDHSLISRGQWQEVHYERDGGYSLPGFIAPLLIHQRVLLEAHTPRFDMTKNLG